ncbi:peptidoglycan DD-metalloendopeptidase family protein [Stella sp.]|uniref:peptidoglycan DD-metalloendopeptidase family protein n=1 Tax=Stella sp. TaxID=2912054 RepID=UPI0035AECBE7
MTGLTMGRRAAAGLCAGLLLWAAPAPAQDAPGGAAAAATPAVPDRETLLRLLAEEMTTRLVTALSIQARSHAAEVATLEYRLRQTEERLERAEGERDRREEAHRRELSAMRDLLARAEAAVGGIGASQAAMKQALETREEDIGRLKAALGAALGSLAEARQEVRRTQAAAAEATAAELAAMRSRLDAATAALEASRGEGRGLAADRDRLAAEAEALRHAEARLRLDRDIAVGERDAMSDRLEQAAARVADPLPSADGLESQALERLGQIEQFLSSTGINVSRLSQPIPAKGAVVPPPLPVSRQGGRGGPFVPLARDREPDAAGKPGPQLERHLDRLERIERVLRVMPIGAPLASYSFESGFGRRSDPFRKRAAMHEGVDLAAPMRTPLHATAPGTVVHAGRKAAYGNTVDVRHAGGLVTRYAHLADVKVSVGDTVARGDVVGLLGSTGRSTGPHVHYEVMIDGTAVDPARFLGRR